MNKVLFKSDFEIRHLAKKTYNANSLNVFVIITTNLRKWKEKSKGLNLKCKKYNGLKLYFVL